LLEQLGQISVPTVGRILARIPRDKPRLPRKGPRRAPKLTQGIPWVFAAVDESYGLAMTIVPGQTPLRAEPFGAEPLRGSPQGEACFCCVFGEPLPLSMSLHRDNCLLGTVTHIVAAIQASQAVRLLLGDNHYATGLLYVDAWDPCLESIEVKGPPEGCRICGRETKRAQPSDGRALFVKSSP